MSNRTPLLEVENIKKHFTQDTGLVNELLGREPKLIQAVDDVSFTLQENEVEGIIGESGCGKTTLLRTLIGLHDLTDGKIYFKGKDTSEFDKNDWKEFRKNVSLVFQDPYNSLNPKYTVRATLIEPLKIHDMAFDEETVVETLDRVGLSPPEKYLDRTPPQLSGGERQRVSIARALITEPDLILADEPVSMLDVSIQAEILQLLSNLTDELGVAMLYISHDLSTVSYVCQRVSVMYLGRIVESAPTKQLIHDPKHPYTKALTNAVPIPDPHYDRPRTSMEGAPQDPINIGEGCRFRDRCPDRMDICEKTPLSITEGDREVACHLYYDHEETTGETPPEAVTLPKDVHQ